MKKVTAELLFDLPCELGEGPLWHEETQTLFWLDILEGRLWHSSLREGRHRAPESWSPSDLVSAVGLRGDGGLVGALVEGIGRFEFGTAPTVFSLPDFDVAKVRFNDGKVGPDGKFWIGSMDRDKTNPLGKLQRIDSQGRTETLVEDLVISNGLGWSEDAKTFYLSDSARRLIYRFRCDPETGNLSQQEVFLNGNEAPGYPDGMAVDAEGCIWNARWGASQVVRLSPEGKVLLTVSVPAPQTSSVCFGGPNRKTLYITTAREELTPDQLKVWPLSGSVFVYQTEVPGLPGFRFD